MERWNVYLCSSLLLVVLLLLLPAAPPTSGQSRLSGRHHLVCLLSIALLMYVAQYVRGCAPVDLPLTLSHAYVYW